MPGALGADKKVWQDAADTVEVQWFDVLNLSNQSTHVE